MILKTQSLTPTALNIICHKATEAPFICDSNTHESAGTYLCRQCGIALFRSQTKFHSGCGWPSFDEAIAHAVKQVPDADGRRTEILCTRCDAHLGHVFQGEQLTAKNTRHCVNSQSLDFVSDQTVIETEEIIFAAGCFWGVEYYFKKLNGVVKTETGYSGGHTENPSYQEICSGNTGHFEVIRVVYDPSKLSAEQTIKYFFEIHDPVQPDGQGPDRGDQYRSAIFYYTETQKKSAQDLINILEKQASKITTQILPATVFWRAEEYHQEYYDKMGKLPYCHRYTKRFED